jgi:predicted RNA-binding Zn-ribbon protein involved in translation (DUF1610 family)
MLMMVAMRSSETSVLTTATHHNIPEDGILRCHRCEKFRSYYEWLFAKVEYDVIFF